MSEASGDPGGENLGAQVEAAERRLREAADAAGAAEERAGAEIQALEADLEKQRQRAAAELEQLRRGHAEELARERQARDRAIAAAESRLAEIEKQAEAAEMRVEEAERRAAATKEPADPGNETRARESAAAWLRGQIEAIRREAERR